MKFSKKAFKAWLESKTRQKVVGRPEHILRCPLCEFLKEQGAKRVIMHIDYRRVDGRQMVANPQWAQKFQIDACAVVDGDDSIQITAKRALSFL